MTPKDHLVYAALYSIWAIYVCYAFGWAIMLVGIGGGLIAIGLIKMAERQ